MGSLQKAEERTAGREKHEVRCAKTFRELLHAYRLVYEQYLKCEYIPANGAKMRYSIRDLLPTAVTFVCIKDTVLLGTLTCESDSPAGLPLDQVFGDALRPFRAAGRHACELTMNASRDSSAVRASHVSMELMTCVTVYALYSGLDDIFFVINPRHLSVFENCFGARRISDAKPCPHVKNNPGILMHGDLKNIRESGQASSRLVEKMLNTIPGHRSYLNRHQLTPKEVALLLRLQPEVLEQASEGEKAELQRWLSASGIADPERAEAA